MALIRRFIKKQFGELLIEKGVLTKEKLEKALRVQREKDTPLSETLLSMGYVTEEDIAQTLTIQYGYPYLQPENYRVDREAAQIIPENVARKYKLVAIDKISTRISTMLIVATSNPLNPKVIEDIEFLTGYKLQIFISKITDIARKIDSIYAK